MSQKQATYQMNELSLDINQPGRRCGNSTRLVDKAIQILFSGKICIVKDHHEHGYNVCSNEDLLRRILQRLEIEHKIKYAKNDSVLDRSVQVNRVDKNIEIHLS